MIRMVSLALCGVLLTAGCTTAVAGVAEPARDSAGIIGIGRSIVDLLPSGAELSHVLQTKMHDDEFPPSVGRLEVLSSWVPPGIDPECAAVVHPFSAAPYRGGTARAAVQKRWPLSKNDFSVSVGAVALASPHDARELFARFVSQWQRCQGTTEVDRHGPDEVGIPDYLNQITDVKNVGPMLTAVVILTTSNDHSPLAFERALGLAYNCIIDVEVTAFDRAEGEVATAGHAHDVAELMMAKAGA